MWESRVLLRQLFQWVRGNVVLCWLISYSFSGLSLFIWFMCSLDRIIFKQKSKYWLTSIGKWKNIEESGWCSIRTWIYGIRNTWPKAASTTFKPLYLEQSIWYLWILISSCYNMEKWHLPPGVFWKFVFISGVLILLKNMCNPQNNWPYCTNWSYCSLGIANTLQLLVE